jgi:hypothetical protein
MKNLPTAKELIETDYFSLHLDTDSICLGSIETAMIEFAKLHVEAALREANESAFITNHKATLDDDRVYKKIDENSILNAYPLTLIK